MDIYFFATELSNGDRVCQLWLRRSSQAVNAADWLAAHGVETTFHRADGWYKTAWLCTLPHLAERLAAHAARRAS